MRLDDLLRYPKLPKTSEDAWMLACSFYCAGHRKVAVELYKTHFVRSASVVKLERLLTSFEFDAREYDIVFRCLNESDGHNRSDFDELIENSGGLVELPSYDFVESAIQSVPNTSKEKAGILASICESTDIGGLALAYLIKHLAENNIRVFMDKRVVSKKFYSIPFMAAISEYASLTPSLRIQIFCRLILFRIIFFYITARIVLVK